MSSDCLKECRTGDLPDLIPARMLNEFAYCPRLAYLEWVQGSLPTTSKVLEAGSDTAGSIDRPRGSPTPEEKGLAAAGPRPDSLVECDEDRPEAETIHTRSLMLSTPTEG